MSAIEGESIKRFRQIIDNDCSMLEKKSYTLITTTNDLNCNKSEHIRKQRGSVRGLQSRSPV